MMDLISFPDNAKIWIYPSDNRFEDDLLEDIQLRIQTFTAQWVSHQKSLRATGGILHNYFVVLVVDESEVSASGCSIDESVSFIKNLETIYHTDFFNRLNFYYIDQEEIKLVAAMQMSEWYQNGKINDSTLFFNTLVQDKRQFIENWLVPLKDSWQKRFI
ncbi:MAG: hypothetical protein JNK69_12865 [Saprospiraceae bacterium]|nr:hypothetical protein [Candidatus Vicinibacter proximus]MBL7824291.1 hypothetical protein [Saprospiraceae bacterium]MCC6843554.1 hypothetical protein [Saprospiraceae bacterium]HRG31724.1 hypothetical protein [Saprospiraceae bacterium]